MEASALYAVATNTKKAQGLLFALIVHQTLSLKLAVSQTPSVGATLDIQEQMEAHVCSAAQARTNMALGLVLV